MSLLRSRIFEGIEALRIRKCRPDRETIAHYVVRKYGTQFNEVFNELELIVDEELLIKVEYKGSISYRLPSSFDTKSSPLLTKHSKILNSVQTTRFILAAVNDVLSRHEPYNVNGIPCQELATTLQKLSPERFAGDKGMIAIDRELFSKNGNLTKSPKGRLYPKDIPIPEDEPDDEDEDDEFEDGQVVATATPKPAKSPRGRPSASATSAKTKTAKSPNPNPKPKAKPGRKSKNSPAAAGTDADFDPEADPNAVYAVKSKPNEILDPEANNTRRTYQGKFFKLVGASSSEPSTATAIVIPVMTSFSVVDSGGGDESDPLNFDVEQLVDEAHNNDADGVLDGDEDFAEYFVTTDNNGVVQLLVKQEPKIEVDDGSGGDRDNYENLISPTSGSGTSCPEVAAAAGKRTVKEEVNSDGELLPTRKRTKR